MVRLTAQGTLDLRTTAGPEFDPTEVTPGGAAGPATVPAPQPAGVEEPAGIKDDGAAHTHHRADRAHHRADHSATAKE